MKPRILIALLVIAGVTGPATFVSADEIAHLTKELVVLTEKYRAAVPSNRPELLSSLRELVQQRTTVLQQVIESDPEVVLQAPLPDATYELLPRDLQVLVEHSLTVEGTIERQGDASRTSPYRLRDRQGRTFQLVTVGNVTPFVEGTTIRITGVQFQDHLVFHGTALTQLRRSLADTQPPTIAITNPQQGHTVGGAITITVRAEDNQRVAQVQALKDGVLLGTKDAGPFEFSWDTTREADGPHTLSARAHDADLNLNTATTTITIDNTPPRIMLMSLVPRQSASGKLRLAAEAADAIGLETVKFLVDGIVVGVAVSEPYAFVWDTTTVSNGFHTIEALAVDRANNMTTSPAINIRMLNANQAPVMDPIEPKSIQESLGLVFTITAHDPDGPRDPLTFTATNLPPWGAFDAITHTFSGTPNFDEASLDQPTTTYEGIRFDVCDSQPLCDHHNTTITVTNINRPPTIAPLARQTLREGQVMTVTALVADADQDVLECTTGQLPPWVELDPTTCTLRGTPSLGLLPPKEDVRTYPPFSVQVCDPAQLCATETLTVQVTNVRHNPALARIGDQRVDEGRLLTLTVQATDIDGDRLNINVIGLPANATFEDHNNGTGVFRWTPAEDQAGSYLLTFKAFKTNDDTFDDQETVTVTVRETSLSISGHVITEAKKPFPGALVELSKSGTLIRQVKTDAKGQYIMTGLRSGKYILRATTRTANAPSQNITHFAPLSQSVELTKTDETEVDFMGLETQ